MKPIQYSKGDKFGDISYLGESHLQVTKGGGRHRYCLFQCHCGKEFVSGLSHVKRLKIRSCGCKHIENIIKTKRENGSHMMTKSNEYAIWCNIKRRCYSESDPYYRIYGGRGISMSDDWKNSFKSFYRDMGSRSEGLSIERIDSDGNYCKENCKWDTMQNQQNNRRNNRYIEYNGDKDTMMNIWRKYAIKGIDHRLFWIRLKHGWDIEKALKTSPLVYKNRSTL